jgi:exodeoxyribonuclease VII large subunit
LFEPNKLLYVPFLPIRIGLITSTGSAACQDFLETIRKSGFGFQILLADSTVQVDNTEKTVLNALATLGQLNPDLVVIIRGGGSKTDLSYLDNEAIARKIAGYHFPVWTGICTVSKGNKALRGCPPSRESMLTFLKKVFPNE